MKKKLFFTAIIFTTGFFCGLFISECWAQPVKDNTVTITEGKVQYSVPEVYELMQVAIALTDTAIFTDGVNMYRNNVQTGTAYYKEVMQTFGSHRNHPFVKKLNESFSKSALNYIYQLQKAYNASFNNNNIVKKKRMPLIRRLYIGTKSVSRNMLEDFGNDIGFRNFYAVHAAYYKNILEETSTKLSLDSVQQWLEKEFITRYDKYKVVISPLTGGFHFTQRFKFQGDKTNIIWIAAPLNYDTLKYTQGQIAAIYTSTAFTEIDHNYVNPVTDKYKKEVNDIMGGNNRKNWIDESGDAAFYGSGYKVFNEYMTHALYLLYIKSKYKNTDYEAAITSKLKGMVGKRKYVRFKEFYESLLQFYETKPAEQTITDLYPMILDWCKKQNEAAQ